MKSNIKLYKNLGLFLMVTGLSSCSTTKYQKPEIDLPDGYRGGEQAQTIQDSTFNNIAKIPYKEFFKDSELLALIEDGLNNNNDLLVAIKQMEIAELGFNQSKWGNIPTVNLTLGPASVTRPSENSMNGIMASQFMGSKYIEDYGSNITISWEADIWGKIKARKEAALAGYLQSYEAAKAVKTRLIAQVADGYYNLLMLDMQLDVTNQNLELVNSTLNLIKRQQELGLTTILSVQQQENTRDQILNTIPTIEQAIITQENALSILTGKMPGEIKRTIKLNELETPEYEAVGLPAEMLSYRPDVISSELSVRQSFANVKVAKKSMYPALNITAQGGLSSFDFQKWFNMPGSLFAMATGSIAQPLLNGKQLKTRYKQTQIAQEQAELNFKQTVLNAVGEVSNILTFLEATDKREKITNDLVNRSELAVQTSTKMFQFDMATYLDVIVAQNNKLQAELELASIKQQKLSSVVNLYRALGGGWQ